MEASLKINCVPFNIKIPQFSLVEPAFTECPQYIKPYTMCLGYNKSKKGKKLKDSHNLFCSKIKYAVQNVMTD